MRYFKIKIGYGEDEYVRIDETELEKAYGVFLTDGKGVFSGGTVRGQDIIAIKEDWHRAMGYNPLYKLRAEDMNEIQKEVGKEYQGVLEHASARVKYLIEHGQQNLIGRGVEIPELAMSEHKALSDGTKKLADKMNIKNN